MELQRNGRLWYWWTGWLAVLLWPEMVGIETSPVPGKHAVAVTCSIRLHFLFVRPDGFNIVPVDWK